MRAWIGWEGGPLGPLNTPSGLKLPASVILGGSCRRGGRARMRVLGLEIGQDSDRSDLFWGGEFRRSKGTQGESSRGLRVWNPDTQGLGSERFYGGRSFGSLAQV